MPYSQERFFHLLQCAKQWRDIILSISSRANSLEPSVESYLIVQSLLNSASNTSDADVLFTQELERYKSRRNKNEYERKRQARKRLEAGITPRRSYSPTLTIPHNTAPPAEMPPDE